MYSHTHSHIPSLQPSRLVPIISPPVVQAAPLQGMRHYERHRYPVYEPQHSPHLERRPSQPYVRHSGVPGPYSPPAPSAEFAALYLRDHAHPAHNTPARSRSRGGGHARTTSPHTREHSDDYHANGHTNIHTHTNVHSAHIPATVRTRAQPRPTTHREHRERDDTRERGRTMHRHERRPSMSEASHVATLGGASSGSHAGHSSRPTKPRPSRQHQVDQPRQQSASHDRTTTTTAATPATAHKHASSQNQKHASQNHTRDHRSHVRAHTTQPPNDHEHAYPPVHHHNDAPLGVAYVPTAVPPNSQPSRSPRDYSHFENEESRARSQSAPRHRTLRPGRSAMRDRYSGRSRSRSRVRFGLEKRPPKRIAIPVGARTRSRSQKPGVDLGWLRAPR